MNKVAKNTIKYNYLKYVFILIGMPLWINIPILGIFPILLFVFLNSPSDYEFQGKSNNFLINNFLLLIVVLTVTLFCALIDIQAPDTAEYLSEYQLCRKIDPIECFQSRPHPFEPGFYLFSYAFFTIANGSNVGFLLLWSFMTNALAIFFICKKIAPKYYALVIIFMLLNPAFYTQTFLMRQFVSVTFLLCGLLDQKNKIMSNIFYAMSILMHYSSIAIFLAIFLGSILDKIFNLFKSIRQGIIGKIIFFAVLLIASLSTVGISSIASSLDLLGNVPQLNILTDKANFFLSNKDLESLGYGFHITIGIIIGFYCVNLYSNKGLNSSINNNKSLEIQHVSRLDRSMSYIYVYQFILLIVTRSLDYLPLRLSLLFMSYAGIFFYFPLERESQLNQNFIKTSLILLGLGLICYFFHFLGTSTTGLFKYLDGRPFTSSIIDYINLAIRRW
jgi:EpsG family